MRVCMYSSIRDSPVGPVEADVIGGVWPASTEVGTHGSGVTAGTVAEVDGMEDPVAGLGGSGATGLAVPCCGSAGLSEAGPMGGVRRCMDSTRSFCCHCMDSIHCT